MQERWIVSSVATKIHMRAYLLAEGARVNRGGWWHGGVTFGGPARLKDAYVHAKATEAERREIRRKVDEYHADPDGYTKRNPGHWMGIFGRVGA